ncbi:MAG: hypothetical protein WC054_11315 [Candidatus Nanopelagicales bacterium]
MSVASSCAGLFQSSTFLGRWLSSRSIIAPAGGSESTDTQVNHYSDSSDSPARIQHTTTNTWQRYISSPDGARDDRDRYRNQH